MKKHATISERIGGPRTVARPPQFSVGVKQFTHFFAARWTGPAVLFFWVFIFGCDETDSDESGKDAENKSALCKDGVDNDDDGAVDCDDAGCTPFCSDGEADRPIVSVSYAINPIIQTNHTADPAPMVFDGKVYLYTGHDEDSADGWFKMDEWRAYSSSDMLNWTDHGSVLKYSDFSWSTGDAWAAQVAYRNDKFYYYVTTSRASGIMAIGVAVSDSPTGPFEDALGAPLVVSGCGDIDPTVFIDDDGQAYLYWGNPNLCFVRLNEDMISYQGRVERVPMTTDSFGVRDDSERPTSYEEGPWLYKRDELYYLVFAAGPISEHIAYATSPGPTGPWTYGGVVMPTQGTSFTNHPGIIDFRGNSYFFYHNGALPGGDGYHRSACFEAFSYNDDGTIPTLNMSTKGPPGVDVIDPYVINEAETIAWASGVETENCREGGMNVTSIEDGDYIRVAGVDFAAGAVSFKARVASEGIGGNIEIRLDSETGTLVGTCAIENTGGAQDWTTVSCPVSGAVDIHDLYFLFTGSEGELFNFDHWQFTSDI
jgi:hypothetical protein